MSDDNKQNTENSSSDKLSPPPPIESDENTGAPEWMATFADLVTLLMCFFVLLFAMSTIQEETFKELIQSLKSALGVQQVPETGTREGLVIPTTVADTPQDKKDDRAMDEAGAMVQKEVEDIVSDVKELVMFNKLGGNVKVEENEDGAVITISDALLFGPGDAAMNQAGEPVMVKIAKVLAQFSYPITVAGHTDNIPINTAKYPSNWELSAVRASDVVRFLISQGVHPALLSAVGRAEFTPIADNKTVKGRAKNRRVEIVYERGNIAKTIAARKM